VHERARAVDRVDQRAQRRTGALLAVALHAGPLGDERERMARADLAAEVLERVLGLLVERVAQVAEAPRAGRAGEVGLLRAAGALEQRAGALADGLVHAARGRQQEVGVEGGRHRAHYAPRRAGR
jgi:hypothetical protein